VARHIFQACPVWIYTQSNITSILCPCVLCTNMVLFDLEPNHEPILNNPVVHET
jgi:hypothetical protein